MSIVENSATHASNIFYDPIGTQESGYLHRNGIENTQQVLNCLSGSENPSTSPKDSHKNTKKSPDNGRIVKDNYGSLKKSKKSRKKSGSTKKSAKRIEDLDRSLSISLEELLQGVNATKSPTNAVDESLDFNSPVVSPDFSENSENQDLFFEQTATARDKLETDELRKTTPNMTPKPDEPTSPTNDPETTKACEINRPLNKGPNLSSKETAVTVTEEMFSSESSHFRDDVLVADTECNNSNNKQNMPQGNIHDGLSRTVDKIPETAKNTKCNHINKPRTKRSAPPNSIDIKKFGVSTLLLSFDTGTDNGNDLSPTSMEVTTILQNFSENPNAQVNCSDERISDAAADFSSSNHIASNALTQSTDSCLTPEYCKELSTLTLEPSEDNVASDDGKLKLSRPRRAKEVQQDVLYSGIITFPGCYDNNRRPVLFIHCDVIDGCCNIGKTQMARLMLYLISMSSYVTLVICKIDEENWEVVKESIILFQENRPGVISKIIVVSKNVNFHPEMDAFQAEHNIIHKIEDLYDFIGCGNLPESLGGNLNYDHRKWVQQRLDVESYVLLCERLQHNFASNTVAMTTATLPATLHDTSEMLNRHRSTMTTLLDDPRVRDLHDTGHRFLVQLSGTDKYENQSYSDKIQSSYESVCSAIQRYVQAADERLLALEKHLLVKQFEESCDRILSWASDRRDELQHKFGEVADSLNELRIQRQEFDLFYLEVVKQYAQCDCLLSEANQLSSSGFLGQVNSQARNAAEKISQVVQDMEMKKEEVETASQLYLFVDQAYSWALAGMKFVASLSMSDAMGTEELEEQIEKYDDYMSNHPPIPNDEFVKMQEIAARYNNIKCQRQCEVAQQKCAETKDLFVKRRKLLVKARDHQLQEIRRKEGKISPELETDQEIIENLTENNNNNNTNDAYSTKSEKSSRALLRHHSDVSHRLTRPNGSANNSSNGGIPMLNGPVESAATPATASSKHRPKKMLKKSASMSGHHNIRLKIGSPMRAEEPDTQGRSKWSLAIEELITTEEEYVKSLNYIIEHYYPLMAQLEDVPQSLRGKRGVIFGNIENICDFHAGQFLEALKECHEQPGRVAEVFIQHRESFGMYALYSKNKPRSDELMREHGTKFFRAKQHSLRDKMDLASYLLKPVQRMGKYALLLHNIAKHSEIQYRSLLKEAETLVKFQLRHGNDLLAMDSIVDCDVDLKEQGELKRQDEFMVFRGRRKFLRHIFLFDDLILLAKPQKFHGGHDVYHYKSSYKTSEIGLTENIGDTGLKFEVWFRRPMQDSIILHSSSEQRKAVWVEDIRSILWKQALRNKANRRNEMVNMGVGSKPHLDIRSSESPITDRSVATERLMGGRVLQSRSRASIAVATFEHACKRPHSTVSTSSTSSNGSFQFAPHQPASMFDFRAIVEGEEYESGSGHGSSICMSNGESDPAENAEVPEVPVDASPQQYVTTV